MAIASPVIEYRRAFTFAASPDVVWNAMEHTGEFESWWAWLGDFRLEGAGLESGATLLGVVSPPLPYRMRVRVDLERCIRPASIDAAVHGDLEGSARLDLTADGDDTRVAVAWTIEMMQRPMRAAARVAYPLLSWGHDRVVDATVHAFRRHLAATADVPRRGQPPAR